MNAVSIPVPTMSCWPIVESSKREGEGGEHEAEQMYHTRRDLLTHTSTHTHSMYRMYSYIRTRNRYRNRQRHCNRNRHLNHLFMQHEI